MPTAAKTVGIDLNSDHLAAFLVDAHSNPTGRPQTFPLLEKGTSPQRRGRLLKSVDTALKWAVSQNAQVIATEKLDFSQNKTLSKQTHQHGQPAKTTRHKAAELPTAQAFQAVTTNTKKHGITHIAVDPAYNSKRGTQYCKPALNQTHQQHANSHHTTTVKNARKNQHHTAKQKTQNQQQPENHQKQSRFQPNREQLTGPPKTKKTTTNRPRR